jgi:hypothetical protein
LFQKRAEPFGSSRINHAVGGDPFTTTRSARVRPTLRNKENQRLLVDLFDNGLISFERSIPCRTTTEVKPSQPGQHQKEQTEKASRHG